MAQRVGGGFPYQQRRCELSLLDTGFWRIPSGRAFQGFASLRSCKVHKTEPLQSLARLRRRQPPNFTTLNCHFERSEAEREIPQAHGLPSRYNKHHSVDDLQLSQLLRLHPDQ